MNRIVKTECGTIIESIIDGEIVSAYFVDDVKKDGKKINNSELYRYPSKGR